MKTPTGNRLLLWLLLAAFGFMRSVPLTAQTFKTLYSFTGSSDGSNPYDGLVLWSNTLYGTTYNGGDSSSGTVFALNADGSGFRTLYTFSGGSDGAKPHGALVLSGRTLYGTTSAGGNNNSGTVFALRVDGTGFNTLHAFTGIDGTAPVSALSLSGTTLYGTSRQGGDSGNGTVFALNIDGTGFNVIQNFSGTDGSSPENVVISGGTLYGVASSGGSGGNGTVFSIKTDGSGFGDLYSFTGTQRGTFPTSLVSSGQALFGTAGGGGTAGYGTVFGVNTNGTGFTALYSFSGSYGRSPVGPLLLSGSTLYGAAQYTGSGGSGTIFAINTNGTGFTNLYNFTPYSGVPGQNGDGVQPNGGLISSGDLLFGTARFGGSFGYGTIFSISLPSAISPPPQLTIIPGFGNLVLTWATNATGFNLQSTTNLGPSAVWTTDTPPPVVVNGQNSVTNPMARFQQFFRLTR